MKKTEHTTVNGTEGKICCICNNWFPLTCFHKCLNIISGFRAQCKECRKKDGKHYRNSNPEKIQEQDKKKYIKYGKKIRQRVKLYKKDNKSLVNANSAKRKASKRNQTPEDANKKEIQFYYDVCTETNELLGGIYFHVEHIQPLAKGGLNHEDNLQILETTLNLEKNDKWPLTEEEKVKYAGVTFEN